MRRSPHWTYPLHNLALCYIETGDSAAAIRTYNERLAKDPRMIATIVPLRDGVSIASKVRD